ncbi:MAG: 50S ribosomal protein L4 [Chloroflexi bacterium]|nr:50S ribosomal protein L4 [Chloroflexota bacterium]
MQLPVHDPSGRVTRMMELDDRVFGAPPRPALLHQVLVGYQANQRQGTADTRTRAEVRGGAAKPYRQKGTGRARQGSRTSPLHRGGGITFGPHPRSYRQVLPRKMRRQALCSALSRQVADQCVTVMGEMKVEQGRTKDAISLLQGLGLAGSILMVTVDTDEALLRATRNLARVRVMRAEDVSALDVASSGRLLMTVGAVERLQARLLAVRSGLGEADDA